VALENCVDVMEFVPGSCTETCHDRNQVMSMEVEDLTDVEEEKSVPMTLPVRKSEHEVSCICVYIIIHMCQISSIACCFSDLRCGEWNLKNRFINVQDD
jgi:hypothetical protein